MSALSLVQASSEKPSDLTLAAQQSCLANSMVACLQSLKLPVTAHVCPSAQRCIPKAETLILGASAKAVEPNIIITMPDKLPATR
jgi:hypothetical protein